VGIPRQHPKIRPHAIATKHRVWQLGADDPFQRIDSGRTARPQTREPAILPERHLHPEQPTIWPSPIDGKRVAADRLARVVEVDHRAILEQNRVPPIGESDDSYGLAGIIDGEGESLDRPRECGQVTHDAVAV